MKSLSQYLQQIKSMMPQKPGDSHEDLSKEYHEAKYKFLMILRPLNQYSASITAATLIISSTITLSASIILANHIGDQVTPYIIFKYMGENIFSFMVLALSIFMIFFSGFIGYYAYFSLTVEKPSSQSKPSVKVKKILSLISAIAMVGIPIFICFLDWVNIDTTILYFYIGYVVAIVLLVYFIKHIKTSIPLIIFLSFILVIFNAALAYYFISDKNISYLISGFSVLWIYMISSVIQVYLVKAYRVKVEAPVQFSFLSILFAIIIYWYAQFFSSTLLMLQFYHLDPSIDQIKSSFDSILLLAAILSVPLLGLLTGIIKNLRIGFLLFVIIPVVVSMSLFFLKVPQQIILTSMGLRNPYPFKVKLVNEAIPFSCSPNDFYHIKINRINYFSCGVKKMDGKKIIENIYYGNFLEEYPNDLIAKNTEYVSPTAYCIYHIKSSNKKFIINPSDHHYLLCTLKWTILSPAAKYCVGDVCS